MHQLALRPRCTGDRVLLRGCASVGGPFFSETFTPCAFDISVLTCFNPKWPNLIFAVAYFELSRKAGRQAPFFGGTILHHRPSLGIYR
jgi:hypothetical protein